MATNKQNTAQTQTNTPAWSMVPETPAITSLQGMVGKTDYATPIRNSYARVQQENERIASNPLGSYTTAHVRDAQRKETNERLNQNMGMDLSNAAMQNQQNTFNQQGTVAGLTRPQFYNASSTGTGQDKFAGGDWLNLALGAGTGALL